MLTQPIPLLVTVQATDRIQVGLVYRCFACGAQATGLVPWPVNPFNLCRLDEWAAHIWYMVRPCGCRGQGRVARLDDCITPLELPNDRSKLYSQMIDDASRVQAVRAAVEFISQHVPQGQRSMDPPTRLVLQLLTGLMPPARAIEEIQVLTLREVHESVTPPEPDQGKHQ